MADEHLDQRPDEAPKRKDYEAPDPSRPWMNTRPPANPEADHEDYARSVERISALVGR